MSEHEIAVTASERAELIALRETEPNPGSPLGELDVAGHTIATLVSPGTELSWMFTGKSFPGYPGYSCAYRVERVGPAVKDIKAGDTVFATGAHRSYQRHTRNRVVAVPDGLDPSVAVIARLMGVSMSTLVTTTARPGATVIITGLGPVGHLAAQVFHVNNYRVIACDPVEWRRKLIADCGIAVHPSIPMKDPSIADQAELAVDCSGHEQAVLDACLTVRKRGEVVVLGTPWKQRTELSAHALTHAIFHRYVVLRSGWEWEVSMDAADFRVGSIMGNLASALNWLHQGKIRTNGFADSASPADAQRVYSELLQQKKQTLTTVFDWRKL